MHSDCTGCPHRAKCLSKACIKETRHEVDAVVTVDVTAHNAIEVRECPLHGGVKTGSFPENIKATELHMRKIHFLKLLLKSAVARKKHRFSLADIHIV